MAKRSLNWNALAGEIDVTGTPIVHENLRTIVTHAGYKDGEGWHPTVMSAQRLLERLLDARRQRAALDEAITNMERLLEAVL